MNCPICNKSGLPDFTSKHVICPQCNSDLKGFALLGKTYSIHKKTVKKQKYIFSLLLVFVVLVFSIIVSFPTKNTNDLPRSIQNNDSIIEVLEAKLNVKELEINKLQSSVVETKEISLLYIVKSGDNLSKIAFFFYNDWELYKMIEKDNNLKPGTIIFPQDTLVIKLKNK